jgi:Predicted GTPase, probable translation factor
MVDFPLKRLLILEKTLIYINFKYIYIVLSSKKPNVWKVYTVLMLLTKSSIPAENFPFCTIDPHSGIVQLPDTRLDKLKKIYNPKKVTPATVEFIDIAGLVKGANKF